MDKKGAIGLSVNFLVIVIISLVILGAGIAFLYQLIGGASQTKALLDARTEDQLERLLLDEGKKVALPNHAKSTYPDELVVFGIGVLNINPTDTQFSLKVEFSTASDENGDLMAVDENDINQNWLLYDSGSFELQEYEHKSIPIGVKIPKDALKGTYIFNAKVTCGSGKGCNPYDTVKKFSVTVK